MDLESRVEVTRRHFERVNREVFAGDPAANPRLAVDVVEPAEVEGMHTLVLITPWTVNGMFFPGPDRGIPSGLDIGARRYPVFSNDLVEVGRYGSVNLLGDVSWATMTTIATSLDPLIPWFREAIRQTYAPSDVADPGRRALLFGRTVPHT